MRQNAIDASIGPKSASDLACCEKSILERACGLHNPMAVNEE
jgi:hypothetical protein